MGHDTGEYTTIWGQDLGATLVEKSARRPSKLRTKLLLQPPHNSTQNLCFYPQGCSKSHLFSHPTIFPHNTLPNNDGFQNYLSGLKNGAESPQKTAKKGASQTQNVRQTWGENAEKPRRNRRNHVRAIFRTIFVTIFRTVSENCGEKIV